MPVSSHPARMLAEQILSAVENLVREAEQESRPLEVDPARARLFELFVTAHGAGFIRDDGDIDLTADGLCRELAERWGLADAARQAPDAQSAFRAEHIGKMRLLWSLMRMWMEWTYAWKRWPEFHDVPADEQN